MITFGSVCSGIEAASRICTACGVDAPIDQFGRQRDGKYGRRAWCLSCAREDSRKHYRANREKRLAAELARRTADPEAYRAARRRQKIKRQYGLTADQHAAMVKSQDGKCAICSRARPLKVDHCHESGRVRALLCGPCNTSLGSFDDSPSLLERAAAYLREHGR